MKDRENGWLEIKLHGGYSEWWLLKNGDIVACFRMKQYKSNEGYP